MVCATDGFGLANQGATAAQQVDALAAIVERQAVEGGPPITATISVAFGCPFDGEVPQDQVVAIPTLVKSAPVPVRLMVGDMSNRQRLLQGLGLPSDE